MKNHSEQVNCPNFPKQKFSLREHTIELRVRYQETDGQGRLHHANYINYFEIGRVELFRAGGYCYRELEEQGIQLVVVEASCEYFQGAAYDDIVHLTTKVVKSRGVRIEHLYEARLGDQLIAKGRTVVACIGTNGKAKRLPDFLRL